MVNPELIKLIFWGKVAGGATAIGSIVWGFIKWLGQISETNRNVTLLASNHIPHLQDALDAHGAALHGIKSDVRDLGTTIEGVSQRLDDTRAGVHTLGEAFLNHLENASKEPEKKKKGKK